MAESSTIEWTEATWNPITGCAVVSPGCTNCYAMKLAGTRLRDLPSRTGLTVETKAGPGWNGTVRLNEEWLTQPLRWRRPRKIFVCAHGDLFAEGVPDAWIARVFAVMALCPQHTFQVLTKRSARMRAYLSDPGLLMRLRGAVCCQDIVLGAEWASDVHYGASDGLPLPNVWLGVSVEDQRRADERVPGLLATPTAVRFVSAEPLLGPIDFTKLGQDANQSENERQDALRGWVYDEDPQDGSAHGITPGYGRLNWIIVGGESGPDARPMHPAWARQIRDACAAAGVAFHFKQWGAWLDEREATARRLAPGPEMFDRFGCAKGPNWRPYDASDRNGGMMIRVGKKAAGRLLDGIKHNGMPEARS